jgi:septal ring factor EnvC (AmiA/AmiB activator)
MQVGYCSIQHLELDPAFICLPMTDQFPRLRLCSNPCPSFPDRRITICFFTMPELPDSSPAKTTASTTPREGPTSRPVSTAPTSNKPDDDADTPDAPLQNRPKTSPLTLFLGIACAILVIVAVVLWGKLGIRDKTIQQRTNRSEQLQAGATHLQGEVDEAKAETVRVQKQLDDARIAANQLKTDLDKSKANAVELQSQLEKARSSSTDFQTQMAEAKVASLKRQGEVEVAQAQTAVMQTQLNKAKTDMTQLQAQFAESKAQIADLQTKLEKAQQEIVTLQKPPVKK